jgi:hypothetical protein
MPPSFFKPSNVPQLVQTMSVIAAGNTIILYYIECREYNYDDVSCTFPSIFLLSHSIDDQCVIPHAKFPSGNILLQYYNISYICELYFMLYSNCKAFI